MYEQVVTKPRVRARRNGFCGVSEVIQMRVVFKWVHRFEIDIGNWSTPNADRWTSAKMMIQTSAALIPAERRTGPKTEIMSVGG